MGKGRVGCVAVDVRRIIDQIMSDPRLAARGRGADGYVSAHVYDDEPLIKTGRQMLEERLPPEPYRAARDLGCAGVDRVSQARLFREQGLLLADVEDDLAYHGSFERYFPTYQAMNDRQLRGYVTWRTHVRAGEVERAPLSFMFVYVYELLNGIGVTGPEEGFATLRGFWGRYRSLEPALDRYLRTWLLEYVAYHGLPVNLVADDPDLRGPLERDRLLLTVLEPQGRSPQEVFDALAALSSYRVEKSRLYHARPDDVCHVALAVLGRLEPYYRKHRATGLQESLFGQKVALPHTMFAAAVFHDPRRHPDAVYTFNEIRRFTCKNGSWTYECFPGERATSTQLGSILLAVDARMRQRLDFPHPLKEVKTPKYLLRFIDQEIDARQTWQAAHAPVRIEIDRSKLQGIRASAAQTCEALLVDEERLMDEPTMAAPAEGTCPAATVPATAAHAGDGPMVNEGLAVEKTAGALGLTVHERALLDCLLTGGDVARIVSDAPMSLDMLVDAVNEKLFDLVGDTVLAFEGPFPVLVDDYVTDVRAVLCD